MTTVFLEAYATREEAWDDTWRLATWMREELGLDDGSWLILPPKRVTLRRGETGKPWQVYARQKGDGDAPSHGGHGTSTAQVPAAAASRT